jgi:hypothetical protein
VHDFVFVIEFQNCGGEHDHGLLWIKDAQYMELIKMKKFKVLLINTFHAMYGSCQLHYRMHNNINTLEHVRKKIMLSIGSIIPYLP